MLEIEMVTSSELEKSRKSAFSTYYFLAKQYADRNCLPVSDLVLSDFKQEINNPCSNQFNYKTPWGGLLALDATNNIVITPNPFEHIEQLTPALSDAFKVLIARPFRVHPAYKIGLGARDEFSDEVAELDLDMIGKVHVSKLRTVLGDTEERPLIYTIRGKGYSLTPIDCLRD